MFKIAICDDDEVTCAFIENIILEYQKSYQKLIDVDVYYSGNELYKFLINDVKYNLIFLDIEMELMNGVEVGKHIRNDISDDITQIVYISAIQDYAMELFQVRPMNFLVKPLTKEKIINSIHKAIDLFNDANVFFEFKIANIYHKISFRDIQYFESENKKIRINTTTGVNEFYGKISNIQKVVPSKDFFLIHKSYLVNIFYVTEYQYDSVQLTNGIILPISQTYRKECRSKILQIKAGKSL